MRSLHSQVLWCNRLQWVLWALMILLGGTFLLLGYLPATRQMSHLDGEIRAYRHDLQDVQGRASTLHQVIEDVRRLRATLDSARQLPKQKNLPQFMLDIERISQQASLKDYSLTPETPIRHELYRQIPITLKFKGDFNNVFAFLQQTEQLQRLTRVRRIDIKSISNDPGQVDVVLSMNIYYSAEE